jgi:hypothetical protein
MVVLVVAVIGVDLVVGIQNPILWLVAEVALDILHPILL